MRFGTAILFALILSSGGAEACGLFGMDWLGTCKAGEDAKKAVEMALQQVRETQKYLVESTPGLHDVAELNKLASSDPKVRQEVIDRYANLLAAAQGASKLDKLPNFQLVASFDFDQTKVFHVDFTRTADGDESTARQLVEIQHSIELSEKTRPTRVHVAPIDDAQVRQQLLAKVDAFIASSAVLHKGGSASLPYAGTVTVPDSYKFEFVTDDQRAKIRGSLADAILSAYSYREDRVASPNRAKDWSLADGRSFAMFFVDDETYKSQGSYDWTITTSVQSTSDPTQIMNQRSIRELRKRHFKALQLKDGTTVYWAFIEMSGNALSAPAIAAQLQERRRALDTIAENLKRSEAAR